MSLMAPLPPRCAWSPSANARHKLSERQIYDTDAAECGTQPDRSGCFRRRVSDDTRRPSVRIGVHHREYALCVFGRDEGEELALVRECERVESEDVTDPLHGGMHGNRSLVQ